MSEEKDKKEPGLEGLLGVAKKSLGEVRNTKDQNLSKWVVHMALEYDVDPDEVADLLEEAHGELKEKDENRD